MLAFRRGLLKPDYKHGLQSRVREELVLNMLSAEQEADLIEKQTMFTAVTSAPHIAPDYVTKRVAAVNSIAHYTVSKREYSPMKYETEEDKLRKRGNFMIKAWKQFANSATMTAFTKVAKEKFRKIKESIF